MIQDQTRSTSKSINVLLVMHGSGSGGVETALATLCKYLDKERIKVTVAVPKEGPFTDRVKAYGVEVVEAPIEWWTPAMWEFGERHYYRFLSTLKDRVGHLVKIIRDKDIDVVHSSTLTVFDGALAARVAGRPHVWNMRGQFDGGAGSSFGIYLPIQTIYDIVNALSTRIVANSHTVKKFLLDYLPSERIDVIQNGVDLSRFEKKEKKEGLENEFLALRGKLKVALIGRIAAVKGIEDFVNASIMVAQTRSDVGFMVIGAVEDEELFNKVKTAVDQAGLGDRVIFTGRRDDVPTILQDIDLLVCASTSEGLPNSCLEAMAASKAVVATRCGGAEEVISDGENGYLVPVGDPQELGLAILKAINDPGCLDLMGAHGRGIVTAQFSAQSCANQYEDLYRQLIDEGHGNGRNHRQWDEVFLLLASNLGAMAQRVVMLEREVRELRGYEIALKDNILFRIAKRIISYIKS
jgi:glycosyltransferase involved in cell wall biosynthesis